MRENGGSQGALVLCLIRAHVAVSAFATAVLAVLVLPAPTQAQLRPLDPLEWRLFDADGPARVELGAGVLDGQRASLAGVRGRLWEVGVVHISWRTGRVLLEASGTALRFFEDEVSLDAPVGGATASGGELRRDAGDWEVTTAVRLTPIDAAVDLALRVGTRLPTTDNGVGLERDEIDFFALIGGRWRVGPLSLSGESGLGIHGTRDPAFEQSDLWLYDVALAYQDGWLVPRVALIGQMDGLNGWAPRGTEELRELRVSLRAGRTRWIQASFVHGLAEFSPAAGLLISAGIMMPSGTPARPAIP